ncbi:hypothetical protein BD410DRAFT_349129 [Rickenella mellea]|uniref:DRBM domain-containing protein n=1 Tax=Rickenella mellea TaxID=50990 RepID=A0A4Y7QLC7_9AGAM|nr:hypothetical protein BD410DRAFT_349129 [Rickenella mellea]
MPRQIHWTTEWNNHIQLIDGNVRNVSWQEFQHPRDTGSWFAIVYYRELEYGRGSSATLSDAKDAASQVAMKTMCPEKHDAIIDRASRKD